MEDFVADRIRRPVYDCIKRNANALSAENAELRARIVELERKVDLLEEIAKNQQASDALMLKILKALYLDEEATALISNQSTKADELKGVRASAAQAK